MIISGTFLLKQEDFVDCFFEYTSPKVLLNFSGQVPEPQVVDFNGIKIAEKYCRAENPFNNYGEYCLIVSLEINKQNINQRQKVTKICDDINRFTSFVTGAPWHMKSKTYFGYNNHSISEDDVYGWSFKIMKRNLPMEIGEGLEMPKPSVGFGDLTHPPTIVEKSPLKDLMYFIQNRDPKNELLDDLIYFYNQALLNDLDIRYLIMCKALEIVNAFYPLSERPEKAFKLLPKEVKNEFGTKNLKWLNTRAQHRYETRHGINKNNGKSHPKMTSIELKEFARLSQLLVSYVVRKEFGLDPLIFKYVN